MQYPISSPKNLLFNAEFKPNGYHYHLELFWQAELGYLGQAIIGVKVPHSSHVASEEYSLLIRNPKICFGFINFKTFECISSACCSGKKDSLDLDIYTDPSDPSVIWNFSILWLRKNIACKFFVLLKTSV